jgi:general secretion pathway protein K
MKRSARGVALVIVLWALAVLAIVLSEFLYAQRTAINAVRNLRHAAVGRSLSLAAIRAGMEEVSQPYRTVTLDPADGQVILNGAVDGAEGEALLPQRSGSIPGLGRYRYRIEDEDGKMNVNEANREQLSRLLAEAGMPVGTERDTIADSVLDWIDSNDLHRANGAEDDYYRTLSPPYLARNSRFDTVEELMLVRGVTRDQFDGASPDWPSLRSLLTVYRSGPLNRNTAPRGVLVAELSPGEAATALAQRGEQPFEGEFGRSYTYTITGEGQAEDAPWPTVLRVVVERARPSDTKGRTDIIRWLGESPAAPAEGADASR